MSPAPPAPPALVGVPYRWVVLGVGAFGAAAFNALRLGLPSISPEIRATYGLTLGEVGLAFTVLGLGVLVATIPWGALTDRVGERPVLAGGLFATSLSLLFAASAGTFGVLLVSLWVAGLFGASVMGSSGRAVMNWFPRSERGMALGVRQMAFPLGGAIAAITLPILAAAGGLELALRGMAGLAFVAAVAAAIWLRPAPPLPEWAIRSQAEAHAGEPGPMRDPRAWRLGIASALLVAAQASLIAFLVLYLVDEHDLSPGLAAAAFAATQLGGAASRIVAGRRSDRDGVRVPLMRRIARRNALLLVAFALLSSTGSVLAIAVALVATISAMSWNGLAVTAAGEIAGRDRSGTAMSLQNAIVSMGTTVVPATFGLLVAATSWELGFFLVAAAPAAAYVVLAPLEGEETRRNDRRDIRLAKISDVAVGSPPSASPTT